MANKLRSAHIKWHRQKMKVNLAAQPLSSSVSDALEFCADRLEMDKFRSSHATIKFIRIFDRLFDILTSRNPLTKNYKAPLRVSNYEFIEKFLDDAYKYVENIKDASGNNITLSGR